MIRLLNIIEKTPTHAPTPEEQLILWSARSELEPEEVDSVRRLLAGHIDWNKLLSLANEHSIEALVNQMFYTHFRDEVPTWVANALRQHTHRSAVLSMYIMGEMRVLTSVFAEQNIPWIVLKGPMLAYSVYEKPVLRQFKDLDILVSPENFARAKELLIGIGYSQNDLPTIKTPRYTESFDRDYHSGFVHPDKPYRVELHWGIGPRLLYPFPENEIWSSQKTVTIGGVDLRDLTIPDQFLMLSVHGYKHLWVRLKWLIDIDRFVRFHSDLKWQEVLARADTRRMRRIVLLNLAMANRLFETPLTAFLKEQIHADRALLPLLNFAAEYVFLGGNTFGNRLKYIAAFADGREHWEDKALYWFHYMTASIVVRRSKIMQRIGFSLLYLAWILCKPLLVQRWRRTSSMN